MKTHKPFPILVLITASLATAATPPTTPASTASQIVQTIAQLNTSAALTGQIPREYFVYIAQVSECLAGAALEQAGMVDTDLVKGGKIRGMCAHLTEGVVLPVGTTQVVRESAIGLQTALRVMLVNGSWTVGVVRPLTDEQISSLFSGAAQANADGQAARAGMGLMMGMGKH